MDQGDGRDVLLYLINRHFSLYGLLYGRKKIQKLVFLVEHLDPDGWRITRSSGLTGYRFKIWLYGPFSEEIYRDLDWLVDRGAIEEDVVGVEKAVVLRELDISLPLYVDDGFPKVIYIYKPRRRILKLIPGFGSVDRWGGDLHPELRRRIDTIVERYGKLSPAELEEEVNSMLKLTPEKKQRYRGVKIDKYLEEEGLA